MGKGKKWIRDMMLYKYNKYNKYFNALFTFSKIFKNMIQFAWYASKITYKREIFYNVNYV